MLSYQNCTLCPRRCGADRTNGQLGFCRQPDKIYAARAAAHYWEEPVISGSFGSGAVFFSGCTLKCLFCQNGVISQENLGKEISTAHLREIFLKLIDDGVQNINLVTPTHFLPSILPALTPKLPVPVVYNCGGYERVETLRMLDGLIDIYLPDFKYYSSYYSERYSRAPDYFDVTVDAIDEMVRQTAEPVIDADGLMRSGTIIRHLMLPNLGSDTAHILRTIAKRWGTEVFVSLMRQFTPCTDLTDYPELLQPITDEAYAEACEQMAFLGLDGWTQDAEAISESFIPHFDGTGVCRAK